MKFINRHENTPTHTQLNILHNVFETRPVTYHKKKPCDIPKLRWKPGIEDGQKPNT